MLRLLIAFAVGAMQRLGSSILIACLVLVCALGARAAPFQNGSFEIGTNPGASFLTLANGNNTDITGWTVILGDIDYIGGYWQPAQGVRSLDLIGDQFVGGVQQTFDTTPGATYSVSFAMSGNPAGGPQFRPLAVTVAGNTQNFTFDITGVTLSNMNWTPHQFNFVATAASTTIQFVSDLTSDPINGCCYGAALDNVQIVGLPNLTIAKSHVGNFTQGQVGATYTLTVSNTGAGPTSGAVTVTEIPPVGLTVTGLAGAGWTCTLGTLSCTRSDALAEGTSYAAIAVTVDIAANAAPLVTNQATVAGGGDIDPSDNTASDPTIVVQVADLTIAKSHVGNFTQGQVGATYTITVTNSGPGPTVGTVTVVDSVPAGLTATALTGTGWGCVLGTLTCTRSDALAAGASYPVLTLTVNVSASAPPSVVNAATVSGGGSASSVTANDSTVIQGTTTPTVIPTLQPLALLLLALLVAASAWRARRG
jgi:choice-of-anchor C domain-containing protein